MNQQPIFPDPPLKKSFRLGTTSFIVPDDIVPNVEKLGPYFDEIELLVFESFPNDVLPTPAVVHRLAELAKEHDLTYNIHLPVDVSLTLEKTADRQMACKQILKVMALFSRLNPTTYTLHLEMPFQMVDALKEEPGISSDKAGFSAIKKGVEQWVENSRYGLVDLLSSGIDPESISIETLDYPFSIAAPLMDEFGLSVCIDAGHQIKYGYDLAQTFEIHQSRTPLIHLHGVDFSNENVKDHTSLDRLPGPLQGLIYQILSGFNGTVSLEVFNLETLNRSLLWLSRWFDKIPGPLNI